MIASRRVIVFIINSLTAGGAERALTQLISRMEDRLQNFASHLVLLDVEEERHETPYFVNKHILDAKFSTWKSVYLLQQLLKSLSPAVTVSFLTRANCANVICSRLLGYPCIISERAHTTSLFGTGAAAAINKHIVRLAYQRADRIIAVTHRVRADLVANFGISESRIGVIYNPIDTELIEQQASDRPAVPLPPSYILAIGRLVPAKNFQLLVKAYRAANPAESLVILGDGDERAALEDLINGLGLTGRVFLPGYVRNPYPIMKAARLFVCSSDTEGFPNALIEAMALGCPVVSTECAIEILDDVSTNTQAGVKAARWGILVPSKRVETLAEAINMALRADDMTIYAERGKERARHFSVQSSVDQYWSTLAPYLDIH